MGRQTLIGSIIGMMDGQYDPNLVTEGSLGSLVENPMGMSSDFGGESGEGDIEAGMMMMPSDEQSEVDMGMDREEGRGFNPEDYDLARDLVDQVGSIERVRELLANLEEVEDTLDLTPSDEGTIDDIAGMMPEDPDGPTAHFNVLSLSSRSDPGQPSPM
jgi:hypothetical protein